MSVGYSPAFNLASHAGAKVVFDEAIQMHRAINLPHRSITRGRRRRRVVARSWSRPAQSRGPPPRAASKANLLSACPTFGSRAAAITHPYPIFTDRQGKDFIDFDEDLHVKDIVNTVKDGYDDIQLVKRYSTAGLGPSQGRHANLNTIRVVGAVTGKSIEAIGTTTFRPPLVPEKFAHSRARLRASAPTSPCTTATSSSARR